MRTERVFTNYRCNQNCTYCTSRLPEDDLASIQLGQVCARIDAALAGEAAEVILTGGEPTLRRDLGALVKHARAKSTAARRVAVVLETNGTLLDDTGARALRDAGLDRAIVNLAGSSATLDVVTRDQGGFQATLRGVRALIAAGIPVELQAAVVRSTRGIVSGLPKLAADLFAEASASGPARLPGIVLVVPTESPDPAEVLTWTESAGAILELDVEARRCGVPLRLARERTPPPCAFPEGARALHLYSSFTQAGGQRSGYRKVEVCQTCLVREGCAGISEAYLARHGLPAMHPIAHERTRRRLTVVSTVEEQMQREFVTPNRCVSAEGAVDEEVIRVNFHCNQSCTFCFVSTHLPPMEGQAVRDAILDAARRNVRITLSGGEPTLNPRLVEYVTLAKAHSKLPVQLQTNAVRLDDRRLVQALAAAGLDEAFVSLHGSTAAISDRVTESPGTFVHSVVGIDHLVGTSIITILNFVLCQANYADIGRFVDLVAQRWPKAIVNISFVAPSADVVPRDPTLIPRYSDVMPHVGRAVAEARRRGLRVTGFESMCGLPLCLLPGGAEGLALAEIPSGFDRGEFVKTSECARCMLETRCYGLRRGYAEMYGTAELRAQTMASG